jgi:(1->4)-alpha-D-glucan 1-alpha-D-glucosylmutase
VTAASDVGDSLEAPTVSEALAEMLAHVAVYRAYVRPGEAPSAESLRRIGEMCGAAAEARPHLKDCLAVLQGLIADTETSGTAGRELLVRFQQVCGPVMAKGVEDTTYYRWHRMVGLNEVGGDPLSVDSPHRDHLHGWARRQAGAFPFGMTTLSTHDTKRSEDVRARLLAVAEDLDGWDAVADAVGAEARDCGVDAPTGYFVAQTVLGTWPISEQRLIDYLLKAVREAKLHTSWNDPDEQYHERVTELARRCRTAPVVRVVEAVLDANRTAIRTTTLATKLLQLTMPGVPDVYQGSEIVERALVDPDNRRPVDFERRDHLVVTLESDPYSGGGAGLDAEKLWLTHRALVLRRDRPELFDATAGYAALDATTPHVLGFLRGGALATVVTRWPGRLARTGWGDAALTLPPGEWTDLLTSRRHVVEGAPTPPGELFADLPVALLLEEPA